MNIWWLCFIFEDYIRMSGDDDKGDISTGKKYETHPDASEGEWSESTAGQKKLDTFAYVRVYNDRNDGYDTRTDCKKEHRFNDSKHHYCNHPYRRQKTSNSDCSQFPEPHGRAYCIHANSRKSRLNASLAETGKPCVFVDDDKVRYINQDNNDNLSGERIVRCPYTIDLVEVNGVRKAPLLMKLLTGDGDTGDPNPGVGHSNGSDRSHKGRSIWEQLAFGQSGAGVTSSKGFCSDPAMADVIIDGSDGGRSCAYFMADGDAMQRWCALESNEVKDDCKCMNVYRDSGKFCLLEENRDKPGCKETMDARDELGLANSESALVGQLPSQCIAGKVCADARLKPQIYEPCPIENYSICAQVTNLDGVSTQDGAEIQNSCESNSVNVSGAGAGGAVIDTFVDTMNDSDSDSDSDDDDDDDDEGEGVDKNLLIGGAVFFVFMMMMMVMMSKK